MPMTSLRPAGGLSYGDLALAAAFALAFALVLLRRRLPPVPRWLWVGGALLLASIVIVEVFPPDSVADLFGSFMDPPYGSSVGPGLRLLVALVAVPIVIATLVERWSAIGLLVKAFIFGVSVSCAAAVLDAYAGTSIQASFAVNREEVEAFLSYQQARYVGLTGHPNTLSMTAVIASPLVLARMADPRRFPAWMAVFVLLLVAVLLTGSRSGLVGMVLVAAGSLALNPALRATLVSRDRRVVAGLAAGVLVTVALIFVVPIQDHSTVDSGQSSGPAAVSRLNPSESSAEESNTIRRQYFEDSVTYISRRPVPGYGFEWIETSHNIYLQLLLSGGLLALAAFLLIYLGYLREAVRIRSRVPQASQADLLGLTVSLLAFLVMGLVSTDLLDRYLYFPAGLVLAMSFMSLRSAAVPPDEPVTEA